MILTRVHPGPAVSIDGAEAGSRDQLLEWYRPGSADWVRLNLVMSVNGSGAGPDGTSESLTNAADRRILGVIRELSDAVLIGAESVRAEGYQVPRRAKLAIITSSGDLSGHRLDPELASQVIIVCPESAAQRSAESVPGALVLVAPDDAGRVSPTHTIAVLRDAGCRSIACEGGPSIARAFLDSGVVDDICLTVSPVIRDASLPVFGSSLGDHPVSLRHILTDDDGFLFTRWAC